MPVVTQNSGINTCPIEILWESFIALRPEFESILICRAVCRHFLESIDSSVQIQLAIKLDALDYEEPNNSSGTSPARLLQSLETHVEAWHTLNWKESRLDIPYGAAYDIAQGFYVAVDNSNARCDLCSAAFLYCTAHSEAHVYTLANVGFVAQECDY